MKSQGNIKKLNFKTAMQYPEPRFCTLISVIQGNPKIDLLKSTLYTN